MLRKIRKGGQWVADKIGGLCALSVLAVAGLTAFAFVPTASAQFTPEDVTVESVFNFANVGAAALGIMAVILATVGGYKLAIGYGMKLIRLLGGRG